MTSLSLRQWFICGLLAFVLLPVLVASQFFLLRYEQSLRHASVSALAQLADQKYRHIGDYLDERYRDLETFASAPGPQRLLTTLVQSDTSALTPAALPSSLQELDNGLRRALNASIYPQMLLFDARGELRYQLHRAPDQAPALAARTQELDPIRQQLNEASELSLALEAALKLRDVRLSRFVLTNQVVPAGTGAPEQIYAWLVAPMLDGAKLLGVMALRLDYQELLPLLAERSGLGASGEIVLAQLHQGALLFTGPLRHVERAAFRHRANVIEVAQSMHAAFSDPPGQGWSVDYAGHEVVAAWRYLPGLNWGMVVKMDSAEALAPLYRLRQQIWTTVALGLLVVLSLAWLAGRRLLRPVRRMTASATLAAAGAPAPTVDESRGPTEIRALARAFNRMYQHSLKHQSELQEKIDQRSWELHAIQAQASASLLERTEQAEAANRAKSTFLASMSHELRTPLNAVLGFTQLIQQDPQLPAKHAEYLTIINHSGQHLLDLINEVLELSKIEAGQMTLDEQVFDLPRLLTEVADLMRVRAHAKRLSFRLELAPELAGTVQGDSGKLRQVLINLIGNAVKFTERGAVIVRARSVVQSDGRLRFDAEVEDSGCGIKTEDLARLFQPFAQLGERTQDGTGLGLALCKRFVTLMGGELSVQSTPGIGSNFRFSLPLTPTKTNAPASTDSEQRPIGLAPGETPRRLLIVDDDAVNRMLLSALLVQLGFAPHEARDGVEAVNEFTAWQPELIWMDIHMPRLDGKAAARQIRTLPGGNLCKIIAVSASVFRDEQREYYQAGFDGFLAKPFRNDSIADLLRLHLGVRFVYSRADKKSAQKRARNIEASTVVGTDTGVTVSVLTRAAAEALPADWLAQFHHAAKTGQMNEMEKLTGELPEEFGDIAGQLRERLQHYDFAALIEFARRG